MISKLPSVYGALSQADLLIISAAGLILLTAAFFAGFSVHRRIISKQLTSRAVMIWTRGMKGLAFSCKVKFSVNRRELIVGGIEVINGTTREIGEL